jgi:hypothetical protein
MNIKGSLLGSGNQQEAGGQKERKKTGKYD